MQSKTMVSPVLLKGATIVLRSIALVFVGLALWACWHMRASPQWNANVVFVVAPLALALLIFGLSLASPTVRVGSAVSVAILIGAFFAIDAYLSRPEVIAPQIARARRLGVEFDTRLPKQVVFEARDHGQALSLPLLPFEYFFGFPDAAIFSNPPLARIVLCNELGSYEYIETDEYGFNNPRGLWRPGGIDVMMIGDSFVEGYCVPRQARMAEVVREAYPRLLNLGRGGLGSLGELALLREYGPPIRPKVVVWCYSENDLGDLAAEVRVPTLARYLNDQDFTQHLYARRDEINTLVTSTIEKRISTLRDRDKLPFAGTRHLVNYWMPTLLNPRLVVNAAQAAADHEQVRSNFMQTMQEAQRVARTLGAEFLFFYLRDFSAERPGSGAATREHEKSILIKGVLGQLGIPMIDLGDAVRARFEDPRDIHRVTGKQPVDAIGNMAGHYNDAGSRFVGEVITQTLQNRFPRLGTSSSNEQASRDDIKPAH